MKILVFCIAARRKMCYNTRMKRTILTLSAVACAVAPYAMSKAAIANWTMFFAQYMAPAKVRVNAVAPGFMVNERSRGYLMTPDGGLSSRGEQVMHHTPMGRFGEAEDLLGCVNWLLDDSVSSFVTGITVPVDGGFLASAGV